MKKLQVFSNPTLNDSGRGYNVIQPVDCSALKTTTVPDWFSEAESKGWTGFSNGIEDELQGFYCEHLGMKGKVSDGSQNPRINSCLIRPPGSVNAKVNREVTTIQSWDGKRPSVELILGDFWMNRLQKYNEQKKAENERLARGINSFGITNNNNNNYYDTYVPIILNTPIPDWREHIMAKVIVPYLLTFKQLPEQEVYNITHTWLESCNQLRELSFDYAEIWRKIRYTRAHKRIPMGKVKLLTEMRSEADPYAYEILQQRLNLVYYTQSKEKEVR
jgi:hypothetical protein